MIKVVNKRRGEQGEYVGGGSPLGNPFIAGRDGSREDVVENYTDWFGDKVAEQDPVVMNELRRLWKLWKTKGELRLQCWCAPLKCHAEVIKEFLEEYE